jgi:hypothetical protein
MEEIIDKVKKGERQPLPTMSYEGTIRRGFSVSSRLVTSRSFKSPARHVRCT